MWGLGPPSSEVARSSFQVAGLFKFLGCSILVDAQVVQDVQVILGSFRLFGLFTLVTRSQGSGAFRDVHGRKKPKGRLLDLLFKCQTRLTFLDVKYPI